LPSIRSLRLGFRSAELQSHGPRDPDSVAARAIVREALIKGAVGW